MLDAPIDVFIFLGIIATILLISAVIVKSTTIGGFSGVLFVLIGAYGLANDIAPLIGVLKWGICFVLMAFGVAILYEVYLSWLPGGED